MKCKICGFEIVEGQETCPGCGTNVEALKQAGNIEYNVVEEATPVEEVAAPVVESTTEQVVEQPVVDESAMAVAEQQSEFTITENDDPIIADEQFVESVPVEAPVASVQEVTPVVEAAPVTSEQEVTPVVEEAPATPVIEEVTPVVEETPATPVIEEVTPVVEETPATPVVEEVTPVVEEAPATPVIEEVTPVASVEEQLKSSTPTEEVKEEKPKKKSKLGLIIGIIIVLLLLVGGAVAYIHFVFGSGYNVVSRTLKVMSNNATKNINEITKSSIVNMTMNFKYNGQLNLDLLNKTSLSFESKIDATSKNEAINITLKSDDASLSGEAVIKDKAIYLTSNDLFDKTIKIDLEEEYDQIKDQLDKTMSYKEEYSRITESIMNHISDEFKELDYKKEYTSIKVDEKNVNVAKTTVELGEKELEKFVKDIYTAIKNDNELIKDLAKISESTVDEIKKSIEESIEYVDFDAQDKLTVAIYTDLTTTKFYKAELKITSEDVTTSVSVEEVESNYIIKVTVPNAIDFVINTKTKKAMVTINGEGETLTINFTYDIKYQDKVEIVAPTDYIDSEELTEEDALKIQTNLTENDFAKKIMELFESKELNYNDMDYDYDYDFDYELDDSDFMLDDTSLETNSTLDMD